LFYSPRAARHCEEWAGLWVRNDVAISLCLVDSTLCYLSFQPLPLWLSFLLKEKKQKFKKEGMLPLAGHTTGPPPLSVRPARLGWCQILLCPLMGGSLNLLS
jgi:hypothetical protein